MFDRLIEDVAGRFGLSADKARQLMGMLTGLIFNQSGGFTGFLDRFRQKGLGNVVQSWVGGGPNEPITPTQVEDALGPSTIGDMASKLGIGTTAVSGALSGLLPNVVNELTEGGQIPTGIPDRLRGLLGGLGDFGKAGMGAGAAAVGAGAATIGSGARAVGDGAYRAAGTSGDAVLAAGSGLRRWVPWLLIGAIVIGGLLFFRGCQHREATPVVTPPATAVLTPPPATAPAPAAEATAPADANAALDQLSGKPFNADALVKALDLMIIHFDTGSAKISADSLDILKKASTAIKAAPVGTKIEVSGHTDNTGNAAANQHLSQARAEAVSAQLASDGVDAAMLSSKGSGQDKPIADNTTGEGRAKNRRIEFTVQQ